MPKTLTLTRTEADLLLDLLEDCDPATAGELRLGLIDEIRSRFGMADYVPPTPATESRPKPPATIPNPGSDEARKQGCTCPVLDNGYGRGWMGMPGVFAWREDCPLHKQNPPY